MSETQNTKLNVTDSKIKDITDFLKSSVLEPAEQEKETIIKEFCLAREEHLQKALGRQATIRQTLKWQIL